MDKAEGTAVVSFARRLDECRNSECLWTLNQCSMLQARNHSGFRARLVAGAVSWLRTSEWGVSRHRNSVSQVIGMAAASQARPCRNVALVITAVLAGPVPVRSRPHLRRLPGLDQPPRWPATGPRARRRSSPLPGSQATPNATAAADRRAGAAAAQAAGRGRAGRRRRHHRLAPGPPPRHRPVAGHDQPDPGPGRAVVPGPRSGPSPPTSGSKQTSPTRPGSPTSPTTGSPTPRPPGRHRDPDLARRLLPLRPHVTAHPGHRPDRARHLPRNRRHHGFPVHPDRQRHGVHHPTLRRQRRPQRPRDRTPPSARQPEELPAEPPHTCGKVERFQQTLKKWLAPTLHPPRLANYNPARRFAHEYNQHRPHRSLPHRPPRPRSTPRCPKPPPRSDRSADTHDRVRHDSIDKAGMVTLTSTAAPPHRRSGEPTPEPTSSCSSKTSTSPSSTPPPANSSAS